MSLDFGKLNFSVSFNPTSAFPLDARSYFESYDAAVAAAATAEEAGSSTTTYYYGQTIAVVETGVATLYTIQPDKTLAEVGGKIEINESVFAHDVDGKLNLYGFADAVAGAQLVKSAEGKLSWVKPDQTTIEGLQTSVETLQTDIENITTSIGSKEQGTGLAGDVATLETSVTELETKIGDPANSDLGTVATGLYAELDTKANKADVYTKTETDTAISTAIAAADHLQRKTVASVSEINPSEEGADKFIYMVAKSGSDGDHYDEYMVINGVTEKVGDWAVDLSEYAKTADVNTELAKKVDIVEGSRLMTNTEGTKLAGIEEGANVNVIDSVDTNQFSIDGDKKLTLLDIALNKVTGLVEALTKKVDVVEGSRLMTDEEGTKLAGIAEGANVNVIDAVSGEFTISVDGKVLNINTIDPSKITGLNGLLNNKVDKVDGKGLSTNDLTDELLAKLNASETNVIDIVKVGGVALDVTEKSVNIPVATTTALGVVKSSTEENKVSVAEDGTMEVTSINVNKLVQTAGEELILNGGSSAK